jgi:predicted metalloprotease
VIAVAGVAMLIAGAITGCSDDSGGSGKVIEGRATSMLFNPDRVGGLPVSEGQSGRRANAPAPEGTVENSDGGDIDKLAMLGVNDIQGFWQENYDKYLPGEFDPVTEFVSYDSSDPNSPILCGSETYQMANAFYCIRDRLIAWDRGNLMPAGIEYFGEMGAVGVIAHEYGHALQWMSGLVDMDTDGLVKEQQADCFAGVYMRSVAAGDSERFDLSTGDGLNRVLAGVIYLRDRPQVGGSGDEHGNALDRVSAFQMGFTGNADQCASIDQQEIEERQGDLPTNVIGFFDEPTLDSPIDQGILDQLMESLKGTFEPSNPPTLTTDVSQCAGAPGGAPTAYCPETNMIYVDIPGLQLVGEPKNEEDDKVLVQGDNTALSMVTSRYALAVQNEKNADLEGTVTALRTACLTGVGQAAMVDGDFTLSPGDTDEAVAGLLTNGIVATDVKGTPAPAGFSRILAYRVGLSSSVDECFERFQ